MSGSHDRDASSPDGLIAEAASWCARTDRDGPSPERDLALHGWLADDPRHRAAFDAVSQTMNDPALIEALRELDELHPSNPALISAPNDCDDLEPGNQEQPLLRPERARFVVRRPRAWVGAGLILVCAAWFAWPVLDLAFAPQTTVSTPPGRTRSIFLPDGSRVELSGGTALQVRFASARRIVRMEQGEAFFTIAPDPDRPFIVEGVDGRVEVRGTAFDLSQTRDGLDLAVHHGRVTFGRSGLFAETIDLSAGQRAQVSAGVVSAIKQFDLDAGDWRTGWLETDGITLAGLAERLNHQQGVVVSVDSRLADKRIAGRFRLNEPESLLRRLSIIHGFSVTRMEAGLMIRPRATEI